MMTKAMAMVMSLLTAAGMLLQMQTSSPMQIQVVPQQNVVGTVFIDAQNGSDSNLCTAVSPCQTLSKARTALQGKPLGQKIAVLRGCPTITPCARGWYYTGATWTLTSADSGNAANPVTWINYPNEFVWVAGGPLLPHSWSTCTTPTCPNVPSTMISACPSCTMYVQNLSAATYPTIAEGFYYNGQYRMQPYSIGPPTSFTGGANSQYPLQKAAVCKATSSTNCAVQGACAAGQFQCSDRITKATSDTTSSWHQVTATNATNPVNQVKEYVHSNWTTGLMRLATSNTDGNACTTSSTIDCYTGHTQAYPSFGPELNHWYFRVGAVEDLQAAGQWVLDVCPSQVGTGCPSGGKDATYNLYYAAKTGETPNSDVQIWPQLQKLATFTSLQYVNFIGLRFGYDAFVTPATGYADTSFWANNSATVTCNPCSNVNFSTMAWDFNGNLGIEFLGTSNNDTITNSVFVGGQTGGIRIGVNPQGGDNDSNTPNNIVIQNNEFISGQRYLHSQGGGITIGSAWGNQVLNNDFTDWYNTPINMGQCAGATTCETHDNLIQANHIVTVGQGVTADDACIHAAVGLAKNNVVSTNYCSDVTEDLGPAGYNGIGLYNDQSSNNVTWTMNTVVRVSKACFLTNSGPDNGAANVIWQNNVCAYGRQAAFMKSKDGTVLALTATGNIVYLDKGNANSSWQYYSGPSWGCGATCTSLYFFDMNMYFSTTNNLASNANFAFTTNSSAVQTFYSFANWQTNPKQDPHSFANVDPQFIGPGFANGDDYDLAGSSPAFCDIQWQPIPYSTIGPTTAVLPQYLASVPFTFPLQLLDKNTGY